MTKEELKKRQLKLYNDYQQKLKELNALYAIDNNPYTVGQLFRDHIGVIKIEKIDVSADHQGVPCCVYEGPEMKLDGTPKKGHAVRGAFQCNEYKQ
jgi:hypothetical protein